MSTSLELLDKIAGLENVSIQYTTSQISGSDGYVTNMQFGQFNPEVMVNNGGPVTKKGITFNVIGDSFEDAEIKALQKVITFMKLGDK